MALNDFGHFLSTPCRLQIDEDLVAAKARTRRELCAQAGQPSEDEVEDISAKLSVLHSHRKHDNGTIAYVVGVTGGGFVPLVSRADS